MDPEVEPEVESEMPPGDIAWTDQLRMGWDSPGWHTPEQETEARAEIEELEASMDFEAEAELEPLTPTPWAGKIGWLSSALLPITEFASLSLDSSPLPGRPETRCEAQLNAPVPRILQSDRTGNFPRRGVGVQVIVSDHMSASRFICRVA